MSKRLFPRWMRSFFVRTFVSYVAVIALVFMLIYLFFQGSLRRYYIDNLKTHLTQVGESLKPKAVDLFDAGDHDGMDQLAKTMGKTIDTRITFVAPDGVVIGDSLKPPREMDNHGDRPEVLEALKGEIKDSTRFSSTMGARMLYLALPVESVESAGETRFVIRVSKYVEDVQQLVRELRGKFLTVLGVLFLVALFVAWNFSRSVSRPVSEIAAATREFAAGNFDVKLFLKEKDELADVADSFNHMVEQQASLFKKLSRNRAELQAIITSMKEGLLVVNRKGRITLCNTSFETIAGKTELMDKSYWEVLRIPGFEAFVDKAFASGDGFYEGVELGDRFYMAGFSPMEEGRKLVVIFRDITGFKQLERMKKDFVVNLTHELKTPLTAIKGFVETLEDEEDIENVGYIDIIKRHTDRMNQIVSDMLVLSELEDANRDVDFETLDLEGMVNNILSIYMEGIRKKGLSLELKIGKGLPEFRGEKFKMEQLFLNLLDNALKYTDKGSIVVGMRGVEDGKSLEIRVANTGMVIPEASIPRLFERFYVVDKSRSRKLGGTGLGLSIVKHVVLLHKGSITVNSTKEKGTVFTMTFPV